MKYKLTALVTISVYTEIEANSLDEAIEIGLERDMCSITTTGGDTEEDVWMCDELDGSPYHIEEV